MSDEEVIKRRLLIDADGTGDDRRLNLLMKSFIKWCNSSENPENVEANHDRLVAQIAHVEFAMKKSNLSADMMKHELTNYEKISGTITSGIEMVKQQIELNKENLVMAKKIRKNRMEYDALAKIINQQPDRQQTMQKLNSLKEELTELETKSAQLEKKLEKRQKDFTVLMRAISELQAELSDDSSGEEDNDEGMQSDSTEEALSVVDDNNMQI